MTSRNEYRPGMTLDQYAAAWVDMHPHIGQLTEYARGRKVITEWGIRGGVSTWALLEGMDEDAQLIGVDIDRYCTLPPDVRKDPRFKFVVGDDILVPLPEHVDLVMIDSSHEYNQTLRELDRAASLTPDLIILHDYLWPGDGHPLDTPDVKRAVDEWVVKGSYKLETVHESRWGLAVLVPK